MEHSGISMIYTETGPTSGISMIYTDMINANHPDLLTIRVGLVVQYVYFYYIFGNFEK